MKRRKTPPELPTLEQLEQEQARCRYRSRYHRTLSDTIGVCLVTAAVTVLITMLLVPVYRIYGSSMAPTLENGQLVAVVKNVPYEKGDLVAFYYGNKLLIKRVIAGPDDMVEVKENGDVYVNGELLEEPYAAEKSHGSPDTAYPLRVTDEHWFLLGDNRTVSMDSRDPQIGCVSQEQIIGKIVFRIWPLDKLQSLTYRSEYTTP